MELTDVNPTTTRRPSVKKHRRSSAGGQALHRWQCKHGKHTTIHIVYELDQPITKEALTELIDVALLQQFPRFRGHVSADERHWCVPEKVDPCRYCETVHLTTSGKDVEAKLQQHVARCLAQDLPDECSWQVQLITCNGAEERCFVLWRIAHTVADGVILSQIMSNVLCKPITEDGATAAPSVLNASPDPAKVTNLRSPPASVGLCERLSSLVGGVAFVLALILWPSDPPTAIKLGPYQWSRREQANKALPQTTEVVEAKRDRLRIGVMTPVAVSELKAAAAALRVSVNDLLLTAMAAGIRSYLGKVQPEAPVAKALQVHAVAVVNPRPVMPQTGPGGSSQLLSDYAAMKGPGCDSATARLEGTWAARGSSTAARGSSTAARGSTTAAASSPTRPPRALEQLPHPLAHRVPSSPAAVQSRLASCRCRAARCRRAHGSREWRARHAS